MTRPRLDLIIDGCPVPYQRTGGSGRRRYMPEKSAAYRARVQLAYMTQVRPGEWLDPDACHREQTASTPAQKRGCSCPWCSSSITMTIRAYLPDRKTRDLSNIAKAIEDALNGLSYRDDRQIDVLCITRHIDPEAPRVVVAVETM